MGLFSKKKIDEPSGATVPAVGPDTDAAGHDVIVDSASGGGEAAAAPTSPGTQPHKSLSETLHTATEAAASGLGVAALVLWSLAVTGWTGFQIVQNGLVWGKLANLAFPRPGSPLVTNNGSPGISHMELKALWALMAIECVLLVFFVALAISLMWVPYMSACRQKRRARRTKRSLLPWLITLVLVAAAWFKLFTLGSALNKMSYQGTWCVSNDNLDIKYTFDPNSAPPPTCQLAPMASGIRQAMVYAMLTIAFHMLVYFVHQPKGTFGKLFGLVPSAIIVALLVLKPVTSLMNMHYTQLAFVAQGNFTFTAELIVALIEFVTAVWLSLYMGWAVHALRLLPRFTNTLLACCGRRYKDVWYEDDDCYDNYDTAAAPDAEPPGKVDLEAASGKPRGVKRSYSLGAASKSIVQQYYYMSQLPSVFGFVSPMITYFSLNITNWWIVFDIIVGAALILLYMLLCGLHRKVLNPSSKR